MAPQSRNPRTARHGLSVNVLLTLAIAAAAVAVIGGLLVVDRTGSAAAGTGGVPEQLRVHQDSNTVLEADGGVTVVEFLDYQCPACAAYYTNVTKGIEADYEGRITFVTRNFPLTAHPLAQQAARAAEAAAGQGRFREMYHRLYDDYRQWALAPDGERVSSDQQRAATLFDGYAEAIGLDLIRFREDVASDAVQDRVDADLTAGAELGISSTPTIFVNGVHFQPEGNRFADVDRQLRSMIDKALDR